ncbi:YhzD family protein [Salisediminibacterium beveridgei]|uniref:YhzD-like protein n=1 Tax=Salisediminibacterium beveridgei TaxID=632773 RepID=A0A1D7QTY2_9BACI|nr:YhzD family protein [Salisediminibacterium beveridgei]AOM82449.1 hypothetical protein BBEV_1080 [Salisediminibacterium beveridgei]
MAKYYVTAYDKIGKNLMNDVIEAETDSEGRELGMKQLEEQSLLGHTARVVNSQGQLLYFHA